MVGNTMVFNMMIICLIKEIRPANYPLTPQGKGQFDWGVSDLQEEDMNDTKIANKTIEALEKKHDKPFFIACGFFHPHLPWYAPQKYFEMVPQKDIIRPEINENDLDDVPLIGKNLVKKGNFSTKVKELNLETSATQGYLASVAYSDAQVGRVLEALDKSPYKENTIVVLISDHGFHLGEKAHWTKGTLWEEATHCVMMFDVPGMTKPKGETNAYVSLQDLYPTMADLCKFEKPSHVDGKSLVTLLNKPSSTWKSTAYTAFSSTNISVRTEKFRYIRYLDNKEELYDCSIDPHEWNNEVNNAKYQTELEKLRTLVPPLSEMVIPVSSKKGKK